MRWGGVVLFSLLIFGCTTGKKGRQPLTLEERIEFVMCNGTLFHPHEKRAFLEIKPIIGLQKEFVLMMFGDPDTTVKNEWVYYKHPKKILVFEKKRVVQIKAHIKKNKKKD